MKNEKQERIGFICCLIASICFYISAILDMIKKDDNWFIGLSLGSAFLAIGCGVYSEYKKKNNKK